MTKTGCLKNRHWGAGTSSRRKGSRGDCWLAIGWRVSQAPANYSWSLASALAAVERGTQPGDVGGLWGDLRRPQTFADGAFFSGFFCMQEAAEMHRWRIYEMERATLCRQGIWEASRAETSAGET